MIKGNKDRAIQMRMRGLSYNVISKKLQIAKSTLSYWFHNDHTSSKIKEENITKAKQQWAKNIRSYNILRAKKALSSVLVSLLYQTRTYFQNK